MRSGVRVLLSLAFTLLLLYLFLRGVDISGAWRETRFSHPLWLVVAVVGSYLHYLLRAARWKTLLSAARTPVSFRLALTCTAIGFFLSAMLPGRPGEVVRPVLLAVRSGISRSFALATVLVERAFLDPLAMVALLVAALLAARSGFETSAESIELRRSVWGAAWALAATLLAGVVAVAWVLARRRTIVSWLRRMSGSSPWRARLLDALERFGDGLAAMGLRRSWPTVALTSLATWLAVALGMWGSMRAFSVEVSPAEAMVLVALAGVGVLLPTPGGVGGFHLAVQIGLTRLFGVSAERSVPAAIFAHLLLLLPALTIGAWATWKQGLDLSALWRGASTPGAPLKVAAIPGEPF